MAKPSSSTPSVVPTPVPSSPPAPSESFMSDLDGTAPSVVETSYGDTTWDGGRVDPTILNLVSWKLDVHATSEDGVEKRGFNAISTVLNHPTKKADPLRSSRKPLPPLAAPPTLPRPPPASHYDAYLQSMTPLYDAFISSQAVASSSTSTSVGDRIQSPSLGDFDGRPSVETAPSDLPPLDTVPSLFFDPEFSLSNAETWAELIGSETESGPGSEIQDNLSTYLDTLERHLVHEISLRSSSFFSALSNLQDLHSESASCLTRISELQGSLKEVGGKQARKGLQVIEEQEKLRVLKVTETGVKSVAELDELLVVAKRLVEEGDWNGGLGYLEGVVKWWKRFALPKSDTATSEHDAELPLATLPALSTLPAILDNLKAKIATQLESSLSFMLTSTLSSDERYDQDASSLALRPLLAGLVRCGQVGEVENIWREAVTVAVREGSRKHLPSSQEDDRDGDKVLEARGASLAQSLQGMDHSSFLALSMSMYTTLLGRIRLAQQVGEEISRLLKNVGSLTPLSIPTSATGPATAATTEPDDLNLSDVLVSACELAHSRSSKILSVRAEQHAALSIEEFVEIFKENWEFILATEQVAGRMIVSLRGVTASQARGFLVSYHAKRLTRSAKLVEEEQWSQVDVTPVVQHVVNLLIQSAVSDPSECYIPPREPSISGNTTSNGSESQKQLSIEERSYFVVGATAESLILLSDYLKVVINLELVVTDVMSRIVEFLKSFNSRTCQVVLGAGAMRSAGLKNITAKHLALASQSLSVIISLIPYIREFVRRHLSPKQAVMLTEFDKLKRDYQEHQNEIHAKLVAIMSDRLAVHVGSLREIDWEVAPAKDAPRPYAEMLVKETATLHKVLSKYLAASTVENVMSEVVGAIVHRLSEEYGKVEFKSDDAKKRMLLDVALISTKLKPVAESASQVSKLETLVKEKPTPRKAIGATMSGFLKRNGSKGPAPGADGVDDSSAVQGAEAEGDDGEEDGTALNPDAGSANGEANEAGTQDAIATTGGAEVPAADAEEAEQESVVAEGTDGINAGVAPSPPAGTVTAQAEEPTTEQEAVTAPLAAEEVDAPPPPPEKASEEMAERGTTDDAPPPPAKEP
ncbi:hypothetical protein IAU60_000754 [Kwoniella sp. DSM 27419]